MKENETEETMSTWISRNNLSWYHKLCINVLKAGPIPRHVAFIMDGNRRYATKENVATRLGHSKGFDKLSQTLLWCQEIGIKEVTVYAFSIENFGRSPEEVETLMSLASDKFEKLLEEVDKLHENGLCIRIIGNLILIPEELRARIAQAVLLTKDNDKAFLNIAFAYTSRDEITNSFQVINDGVHAKEIDEHDISEYLINKCMYSGKSTKPDILIRTSGEVRFSDFLLWQTWNTNVIFHKVLWPDFTIWHLLACVFYYQMYYAHQTRIENEFGFEHRDDKNEKVEFFLKNLESKRMKQLETYASYLTQNVSN
ncbi:dehydrodolichyl diphosphate synthase complex subunit DHDDS [Atheta coriaria]|uniref:dehydrodolichyl diphosphate synthase complex subunit DHDDS n=1 Tax=Dalotia coriaria TaxID=877792 RepID=UPI0031F46EA1